MPLTFERTADSFFLQQYLEAHQDDGLVSYAALSEHISRDVSGPARSALAMARKALQRDNNIVFGVVRGKGLRKLAPGEIVGSAPERARRLRRAAKRAGDVVACADYAALSADEQVAHNTYLSLFGAIRAVTKKTAVERIQHTVTSANDVLPVGRTLTLFGGSEK